MKRFYENDSLSKLRQEKEIQHANKFLFLPHLTRWLCQWDVNAFQKLSIGDKLLKSNALVSP